MSVRETLLQEILKQPEPILREIQHYLAFLVEQEKHESNGTSTSATVAWPDGYFQKTAGAIAGEPLERPPQLPFEQREDWQT